jgi:hypothetical protein
MERVKKMWFRVKAWLPTEGRGIQPFLSQVMDQGVALKYQANLANLGYRTELIGPLRNAPRQKVPAVVRQLTSELLATPPEQHPEEMHGGGK